MNLKDKIDLLIDHLAHPEFYSAAEHEELLRSVIGITVHTKCGDLEHIIKDVDFHPTDNGDYDPSYCPGYIVAQNGYTIHVDQVDWDERG